MVNYIALLGIGSWIADAFAEIFDIGAGILNPSAPYVANGVYHKTAALYQSPATGNLYVLSKIESSMYSDLNSTWGHTGARVDENGRVDWDGYLDLYAGLEW